MQTYQTIQLPGPIKIIDGVFMGNSLAAMDLDWLTINHVTHIVNCAGKDLAGRQYEKQGIQYLVFDWTEIQVQPQLFGAGDSNLDLFIQFIEKSRSGCGSALIHGKDSDSRTCCLMVGYFMKHFGWNIFKTLQFINSRNKDAQLQPKFFEQLNFLHKRLSQNGTVKPFGWELAQFKNQAQKLITNTFLNSQQQANKIQSQLISQRQKDRLSSHRTLSKTPSKASKKQRKRIQWKDISINNANNKLSHQYKYHETQKISQRQYIPKQFQCKSILKGHKNPEQLILDRRTSLQKSSKVSRSISKHPQKQKIQQNKNDSYLTSSTSKIKSVKKYNMNSIMYNYKQNLNYQFFQNQLVKDQGGQFGRLRGKKTKDPQVLGWTRMQVKNIKNLDDEMKKRQLNSLSTLSTNTLSNTNINPIIIMKPNMSISILQPNLKRSSSQKKQQQVKIPIQQQSASNIIDTNYMKLLRNKLNQTIQQPQILSTFKRQPRIETTGLKRQRCLSAKTQKDKQNDLFFANNLSQNQMIIKPKWK